MSTAVGLMRDTVVAMSTGLDGWPRSLALLTIDIQQEDNTWIGTCIELGTSTYADSVEQLRNEMSDAVSLQLNEMVRLGYITEYLQEQGVTEMPIPKPHEHPGQSGAHWGLVGAGV